MITKLENNENSIPVDYELRIDTASSHNDPEATRKIYFITSLKINELEYITGKMVQVNIMTMDAVYNYLISPIKYEDVSVYKGHINVTKDVRLKLIDDVIMRNRGKK